MKKLLLAILFSATLAFGQSSTGNITAAGSTCATTNACIRLNLPVTPGQLASTAGLVISGTFSGTFQFEVSADNVNYAAVLASPVGSGSAVSSTTGVGTWTVPVAGMLQVRVRCSAYTSGTAVVTLTAGASGANGGVTGSGAINTIPIFTASSALGNSPLTVSGTNNVTNSGSSFQLGPSPVISLEAFGVVGDAKFNYTATMVTSGNAICSSSVPCVKTNSGTVQFTPFDVNKSITLTSAGSANSATYPVALAPGTITASPVGSGGSLANNTYPFIRGVFINDSAGYITQMSATSVETAVSHTTSGSSQVSVTVPTVPAWATGFMLAASYTLAGANTWGGAGFEVVQPMDQVNAVCSVTPTVTTLACPSGTITLNNISLTGGPATILGATEWWFQWLQDESSMGPVPGNPQGSFQTTIAAVGSGATSRYATLAAYPQCATGVTCSNLLTAATTIPITWGTENTAAFNAAKATCPVQATPTTLGNNSGCNLQFAGSPLTTNISGSGGTGNYYFEAGLPQISQNNVTVSSPTFGGDNGVIGMLPTDAVPWHRAPIAIIPGSPAPCAQWYLSGSTLNNAGWDNLACNDVEFIATSGIDLVNVMGFYLNNPIEQGLFSGPCTFMDAGDADATAGLTQVGIIINPRELCLAGNVWFNTSDIKTVGGTLAGTRASIAAPSAPSVAASTSSGTLGAATYYTAVTYTDANSTETTPSSCTTTVLGGTGKLTVTSPSSTPISGTPTGYNTYIGTTAACVGATKQNGGTPTTLGSSYVQSSALTAGAAQPAGNSIADPRANGSFIARNPSAGAGNTVIPGAFRYSDTSFRDFDLSSGYSYDAQDVNYLGTKFEELQNVYVRPGTGFIYDGTSTARCLNGKVVGASVYNVNQGVNITGNCSNVYAIANNFANNVNLFGQNLSSNGYSLDGNGGLQDGEKSAPTGVAGFDILYGDSTAHRWKVINNNGTAAQVVDSGVDVNTSDQVASIAGAAASSVFDLSEATGTAALKVPSNTSNTASAAGVVDYDSTSSNYHVYNGADSLLVPVTTSAPLVNGNLVKASVSSSKEILQDSGIVAANVPVVGGMIFGTCSGVIHTAASSTTVSYLTPTAQSLTCSSATQLQHQATVAFKPISLTLLLSTGEGNADVADTFGLYDITQGKFIISCQPGTTSATTCSATNSSNSVASGDAWDVRVSDVVSSSTVSTSASVRMDIQIQ